MDAIYNASFIKAGEDIGDVCPAFVRDFAVSGEVKSAELQISALGAYEAYINGCRIGRFFLAPGWTSYETRLQYQKYDVTELIEEFNSIEIGAGIGFRFHPRETEKIDGLGYAEPAVIASLKIEYLDGKTEYINTDGAWKAKRTNILYSNIYNGETVDYTVDTADDMPVTVLGCKKDMLVLQDGEDLTENARIPAGELIITPKGERVIDFLQEITGYVELRFKGKPGDEIVIHHFEMLDCDGNAYTENLRTAKNEIRIICDGFEHTYKPHYSFQGFRYIRLTQYPDDIDLENFSAVVVFSHMKRTGFFKCGDEDVNRLFENIVWGQRGNFLDVPTDCPQRDERLGWTGDAQVFAKTASIIYDTNTFFRKWLRDLAADQFSNGSVPHVIPDTLTPGDDRTDGHGGSAAWADAAVICPWQVYLAFGDRELLREQYPSMKKWVDYMETSSGGKGIWGEDHPHFGDWLSLDAGNEATGGKTPHDMIANAYFYYSTGLLVKAGHIIGEDVSHYEKLLPIIKAAYNKKYIAENGETVTGTQTSSVITLYFGLAEKKEPLINQLVRDIVECGHLKTGFVGTPYLCHVLTAAGRSDVAYNLLLRKEFPSWLYPVTMGATTMWERWDGMKPDRSFATPDMNSFNHYAYGAVGDWLFGTVAGINIDESAPAYRRVIFAPVPDKRLGYASASIITRNGTVASMWEYKGDTVKYTFTLPEGVSGEVRIGSDTFELNEGTHSIEY